MWHHPVARAWPKSSLRVIISSAALAGSLFVAVTATSQRAGAAGILPPSTPSVDVPPQVKPACTTSPVDDSSATCLDSVLHDINEGRNLEGLGPMVLPSDYATDPVPVQQLIIVDEERGDRGLPEFNGLDAALNTAALTGAQNNQDPSPPAGYSYSLIDSNFAQDDTPLGADFAWMYNDGWGGTNAECVSSSDSHCWGHRNAILGNWTTNGSQTAQLGVADTASGQYAQEFADQNDPADGLVDTITTSSLPTPATPAAPDVVQVLPASSRNTGAGTPVTIEGNYFTTAPLPQVYFGGVPATNVHVDWNGELTAVAPADPAGTAPDTVVVTVATNAGTSSSSPVAQVDEFTYAPLGAPSVSSISPSSGPQDQLHPGTITINGSNLATGGAPIVDFGTVASIGLSGNSNTLTANVPPSLSPGTVNVTVTTSAGTSASSAALQFTYTGSGSTAAPAITSTNAATFSSGSTSVLDITTTGTPGVSSVSDTAFAGCTPSALPASVHLWYAGGTTATLVGTPQPGDANTYRVCLNASNGVSPVATQALTLTVDAPALPPPPAPPPPPPVPAPAPSHGYWLVGSDGGIFTFGSAQFYGSTGSLHLQRPVVGITPTGDRGGYWLVASDGGIFAFGDAGFHGSIPGAGLNPAGSGKPHSLNAPIVGMVPSADGGGYFMVASDGGVFAFGDARFEGSCPGIGGCAGTAVAVVPDATGNGYWVVTTIGAVYTFGDAVGYGAPGLQNSPMTSAVATPNGGGYWILDAAGQVFSYGNTAALGGLPAGTAGGLDPASAIFETSDGGGYWVATAGGVVRAFGDAPADGDMSGTHLNGPIIAASGS